MASQTKNWNAMVRGPTHDQNNRMHYARYQQPTYNDSYDHSLVSSTMTVQRAEQQPFGAHYGEDGLMDAEEEEEAQSPNFNEYNNAMMHMHA